MTRHILGRITSLFEMCTFAFANDVYIAHVAHMFILSAPAAWHNYGLFEIV
jgi:hypothetical protein